MSLSKVPLAVDLMYSDVCVSILFIFSYYSLLTFSHFLLPTEVFFYLRCCIE